MPAAAIATLVIVAVIVLALAWYLTRVILILRHVNDQLGKITFGVRAIAHRTEPVTGLVGPIVGDLDAVAGALEALVAKATAGATAPATAASAV